MSYPATLSLLFAASIAKDMFSAAVEVRQELGLGVGQAAALGAKITLGEKALKLMNQSSWDVDLLKELSSAMMDASICGLGQAAPNPMLSVIKHFPEEVTN